MLKIKSKGTEKKLLEASDREVQLYFGDNCRVYSDSVWSKLAIQNTSVSVPGGNEFVKVAHLPSECSHPERSLGVFALMNSAWRPTMNMVFLMIMADGGIYARSEGPVSGVLLCEWSSPSFKIFGGGVLKTIKNLKYYLQKLFSTGLASHPKGELACR